MIGRRGFGPALKPPVQTSSPPLNPAGFSFGFGGFGKLLLLKLALGRRWRNRPRNPSGPPRFELSLKVQRNVAH